MRFMRRIALAAVVLAFSVSAQTVTGDTTKQCGAISRLSGIDAPEAKQVCAALGRQTLATI
jgi:endonuclease YncB( thermonuclease family)